MERAYLQQLLHNKIKQKENERLTDHAQSVKDTKQEHLGGILLDSQIVYKPGSVI